MATTWSLYIIRCSRGTLYTGIATDVERRFDEHQSGQGKGAKYLRGRGPLEMLFHTKVGSKGDALRAERAVKRLSKARKLKLIEGQLLLSEL